MKKVDSHLHVWADDPDTYPYREGQAMPTARGNAEFLLRLMDDAGANAGRVCNKEEGEGWAH